ncbi:MAG TPA: formate/nitrite transporter family protein [Acidisarcina sp.]
MPVKNLKLNLEPSQADGSSQQDLDRPTASDIFEQVARNARQELKRPLLALAISGLVGGLTMGLTGLGVSIAAAELGTSPVAQFVAHLLYPVGFIAVILGRAQLFTENTLYPVALILSERRHLLSTLRLWSIVLPCNLIGALLFALLAERSGALRPEYLASLTRIGVEAASGTPSHIFWSGVIGGWIIALVAWMVSGSHSVTGSVMLIWVLTFLVGIGHFAHCIASSGEILSSVLSHQTALSAYLSWLGPAVAGNITGGVVLVTLLEYGQVHGRSA